MNEKELKTLTDSVVSAVEPVVEEKVKALKEEVVESQKDFATKEDVKAAVVANVGNDEEAEKARQVKTFSMFVKALKKTNNVAMAVEQVKAANVADIQNELNELEGGVLVPEQLMSGILAKLGNYGIVRKNATVIPMSREAYSMKDIAELPTVFWVDEGVKGQKQKLNFTNPKLVAKKAMVLIGASLELIEDSTPDNDVWEVVSDAMVKALLKFEDKEGLEAVLNSTDVNVVTTASTTFAPTYDEIVDLIHSVNDDYFTSEDELEFYGSRSVLGALRKIKDTNGTPIYSTNSKEHYISGYKFNVVSTMPKLSTLTASEKGLVFGSLKGLFMGDRKKLTIDIGNADGDFERYTQTARGVERIDFNLAYPEALAVLKNAA